MALIKCAECGNDVSTEAKACPKCGAKVRLPKKPSQVGKLLIVVLLIGAAMAMFSQNEHEAAEAAKSPEQRAQEAKASELAAKRELVAVAALKAIKTNLRNPDSVKWGDVLSNDDGSVICIDYRAQNGFGGMNQESIAIIAGKPRQDAAAWNKNCAHKTLNDLTDRVVRRID